VLNSGVLAGGHNLTTGGTVLSVTVSRLGCLNRYSKGTIQHGTLVLSPAVSSELSLSVSAFDIQPNNIT
jgi:hypothetical protein